MLRIFFTAADLARVRIAPDPDPLWETVLSLHQLSAPVPVAAPYRQWSGWIRTVARSRVSHAAHVLHRIAPPQTYFPDFLTPAAARDGLEAGVDAILHTPRSRLRAELARAGTANDLPAWGHEIADGCPRRLSWMVSAIRAYHREALGPFQRQISTHLDGHRARLTEIMHSSGVDAMLGELGPGIRWTFPVLTADYPADLDVRLNGRGLTLVPSVFCHRTPVTLADPELEPVLVYPTNPSTAWLQPGEPAVGRDRQLEALVGGTRASLLRALTRPCGTGQLARRLGLSMSSASEHTTVLRNAGLVTSTRDGRMVTHRLTALGRSLLAGEILP